MNRNLLDFALFENNWRECEVFLSCCLLVLPP